MIPLKDMGLIGASQLLARHFIVEAKKKGYTVREIEIKLQSEGNVAMYGQKLTQIACGNPEAICFQHFYFYSVLYESIGLSLVEVFLSGFDRELAYPGGVGDPLLKEGK